MVDLPNFISEFSLGQKIEEFHLSCIVSLGPFFESKISMHFHLIHPLPHKAKSTLKMLCFCVNFSFSKGVSVMFLTEILAFEFSAISGNVWRE